MPARAVAGDARLRVRRGHGGAYRLTEAMARAPGRFAISLALLAPAVAQARLSGVPLAFGQARLRVLHRHRDAAAGALRVGRRQRPRRRRSTRPARAKRIKITDTVRDPKAQVLAYGHSDEVRQAAVHLPDDRDHLPSTRSSHGFIVSVEKQRVF